MPAASAVPKAFGDPGWNGYTKNGSQDTLRPPNLLETLPHMWFVLPKHLRGKHDEHLSWETILFNTLSFWSGLQVCFNHFPCHFFESPNSSTFAWNMLGEATLFAEAIYCRANGPNSLFNGTQQFVRLACPLTAPCHENGTFFRATKVERGQFLQKKTQISSDFLSIFDDSWVGTQTPNAFPVVRFKGACGSSSTHINSWLDGIFGGHSIFWPFPVARRMHSSYKLEQWAVCLTGF